MARPIRLVSAASAAQGQCGCHPLLPSAGSSCPAAGKPLHLLTVSRATSFSESQSRRRWSMPGEIRPAQECACRRRSRLPAHNPGEVRSHVIPVERHRDPLRLRTASPPVFPAPWNSLRTTPACPGAPPSDSIRGRERYTPSAALSALPPGHDVRHDIAGICSK